MLRLPLCCALLSALCALPALSATPVPVGPEGGQVLFTQSSQSMEPTIPHDSQLVFEPFGAGGPQRGDLVMMIPPEMAGQRWVKRLIGLPGDTVRMHEGKVYLNGKALHEPYINPAPPSADDMPDPEARRNMLEYPATTLAADRYFVLGDNRARSADSRYFGPVGRATLVGKVALWQDVMADAARRHAMLQRYVAGLNQRTRLPLAMDDGWTLTRFALSSDEVVEMHVRLDPQASAKLAQLPPQQLQTWLQPQACAASRQVPGLTMRYLMQGSDGKQTAVDLDTRQCQAG